MLCPALLYTVPFVVLCDALYYSVLFAYGIQNRTGLLSLASLPELQHIVSIILVENIEAVNYATMSVREGEDVARRHRKSLLDPQEFLPQSITENMVACFNKLDLLITNMALDKVRSRYNSEQKNEQLEYLDQFVMKIDSSQTLARLLSQSPNQRTSEAAAARYKRNAADHHIPGSPRHLIERLMYEGFKANLEHAHADPGRTDLYIGRKLTVKDGEGNPYSTKPFVDILAIARDVIAERGSLCVVFTTKITDLTLLRVTSVKEMAHFLARARDAENFLVIDQAGIPMDGTKSIQLRFSAPAFLSPSVSINMDPTTGGVGVGGNTGGSVGAGGGNYSLSVRAVSNRLNDDGSINAEALSEVLSSFFRLKGDRGNAGNIEGGEGGEGREGMREADPSAADPSDSNEVQIKVKVINRGVPTPSEKLPLGETIDRSGSNDESRAVGGVEVPVGDLSAFLQLGPDARIRLVSQAETQGQKYLLLEGKSLPMEGPRGLHVRAVRVWISYNEAVEFLNKNGATAGLSEEASTLGVEAEADAEAVAGSQKDLQDDDSSPFFGGNIPMM